MRLAFADPRNLTLSPLNMHYGRPDPDVSDILPSIRRRGVLLTLLVREVRAEGAVVEDRFEIVAGRRRWKAALAALAEGVEIDPVPIGILEAGDDAAAIEASLIENLGRLPPDEVTCWETFARLVRSGRTAEQIAAVFGMSEAVVKRTLALGQLLPRLRNLYRREAIDVATVRALTLASKAQQKAWLALFDDPEQRAPTGSSLKAWLFGGASIPTKNALFSLDDYPGQIRADLFGEDSYFVDAGLFWRCQNEAVAARREALLAAGWGEVEVLEAGQPFYSWKHVKTPRTQGGKVFIAVGLKGEVEVHEGWLTDKEARRARAAAEKAARGERPEAAEAARLARPEVTRAQGAYIDLHRHAAVRVALTEHPAVALRMLVAHAVAGSPHWQVKAEPRAPHDPAVAASLAASPAEAAFAERRREAAALLGLGQGAEALLGRRDGGGAAAVFARLLGLSDAAVLAVAAAVMAESLEAGSDAVEAAGAWLKVDVRRFWAPDGAFFELMRDREIANAMLKEVGGKKVADGNLTEKVKTQTGILRDFLDGANGRAKVEGWTPKWLGFPAQAYTRRPFAPARRARAVAPLLRRADAALAPEPAAVAAE
ncbi:MAG: chromosome partitioning protein ParB [Phenylobacterium sp.]|uniref:ParB/RepB/Spo0J family partition protein n=1 Tax=Phenylobacterium sp. TaxID=1871053 RepID=UPI0025EADE3A|nr:ParB N-terminal domain-containing protein [Phenylobacterium sp.]MBI1198525.1 chromosome partitioning protein ParB [Phenylobacterium sp.]